MIRLIFREDDATAQAHGAGPLETGYRTFDVSLPEVEAWLAKADLHGSNWVTRQFVGIERIAEAEKPHPSDCTRIPGHDGPCNGFLRKECIRATGGKA